MKPQYLFLVILFLLPLVRSEIYIQDEPLLKYNVGEFISVIFDVEEDLPVSGYVEAELICGSDSKTVFKEFKNFQVKNNYEFSVVVFADEVDECYIEITFRDEEEQTRNFKIVDDLKIEYSLSSKTFSPGGIISISGNVSKVNGEKLNYSAEINLGDVYSKKYSLTDSEFNFEILLTNDTLSGKYDLEILFQEKDLFDEVINSGEIDEEINVLSKATSILIEAVEEITPPENLSVQITLRDQGMKKISNETLIYRIQDPENNIFQEGTVKSGEIFYVNFSGSAKIGGWKINSFYSSLSALKPIYINEYRDLSVNFIEGTGKFLIENIGNLPYEGVIELFLMNGSDDEIIAINVDLDTEEEMNYTLSQIGSYNVSYGNETFKNIYLTGAVISTANLVSYWPFLLTFVVIIILVIGIIFGKKKSKEGISNEKLKIKSNKKHKNKIFKERKKFQVPKFSFEINNKKKIENIKEVKKPKINSEIIKERSEKIENTEKLYGLFFKKSPSRELLAILENYNFKVRLIGSTSVCVFKSNKNPEERLLRLVKLILEKTYDRDFLIYSQILTNDKDNMRLFPRVRFILEKYNGVLFSEDVYNKLSEKNNFNFVGYYRMKETLIKLYRYN